MLYRNVTVILIENSTAGNPPKTFVGQTVDIVHENDTVDRGVDGITSVAHQPSTVIWFGRTAKDLESITDVKIIGSDGGTLIDAQVYSTRGLPHDVVNGVGFFPIVRE